MRVYFIETHARKRVQARVFLTMFDERAGQSYHVRVRNLGEAILFEKIYIHRFGERRVLLHAEWSPRAA